MTAPDSDVERASSAAASMPPSAGRLAPGTSLAGRYTVAALLRRSPFAEVYQASDATGTPVSVHLLHEQWMSRPELGRLLVDGARAATGLDHKNIARTIEVLGEGTLTCVVTEYLEGSPLRELLARKRETGATGFGARAANNILGGVCNALTAAHIDMPHGALGPDSIYVNSAGRVKVADFGLGLALPAAVRAGATPPPSVAPEVADSGEATRAGDIFALGTLLYELLVGEPLRPGGRRPSEAAEVAPVVDQLVSRCCAPEPGKRPADAATLKAAATQALKLPSGQRAAAAPAQAAAAVAAAAPAARPVATASPAARPVAAASSPAIAATAAPGVAEALADTEERWLVSKGKLDYGPFSFAEIVEQIRADQILPGNVLVDNFTGERCHVDDHPLLAPLVDQARQARDDRRRANAEVVHAKQESRRGLALYGFVGAGVVGLALAAWFIVQKAQADSEKEELGGIAAIEEGQLQPKFSFPEPKKKETRRRSSSGRRTGGGGGGDSAEMMNFDDDVGSERLDNSQVNSVIQRHGGRLGGCLQRNGGGYVRIFFQVRGKDGKVIKVKVNDQESGALYGCIDKAMRAMKFPTFDGLRSGHEFEMSL